MTCVRAIGSVRKGSWVVAMYAEISWWWDGKGSCVNPQGKSEGQAVWSPWGSSTPARLGQSERGRAGREPNGLQLCCPIRGPLATRFYGALEMWLARTDTQCIINGTLQRLWMKTSNISFFLFFFFGGPGVWIQDFVFACLRSILLWDGISWTMCLGWLRTTILLSWTSQVARITGMSHQHPA
jgi:hypothetical protein